jgi:predicted glycoside hydrolase/deacetylase ChbG (UPF0249 family)
VGVYELGCHPGIAERGFTEKDEIGEQREHELEVLISPILKSIVQRRDIKLISYTQLLES